MKLKLFALLSALLCLSINLFSQTDQDLIIIDEIADDITELIEQYKDHPQVYVTDGNTPDALRQISDQLVSLRIENLHIFVPTKPGAIVFSSIALTPENLEELPFDLTDWTEVISGKVIIHSDVVFTGEQGQLLKQVLENRTGLEFISQY